MLRKKKQGMMGDVSLFTIVRCETLLQIGFVSFKNWNFLKFKIGIGLKSSWMYFESYSDAFQVCVYTVCV